MSGDSGVGLGLDALFAGVLTIFGWIVAAIRKDHRDLREDHDELTRRLPETYARRDDVKDALSDIKEQHRLINSKLDRLLSGSVR